MSEMLVDGAIKLTIAVIVGSIIGAEREYKSKSVGFRTVILITLGSCLFTILSYEMGGEKDPTRIAANIITGIGFLGAGAIFKEGASVKGITTASTIWVSAAIGMAVGIGHYDFAFIALALVMIVLLGFSFFQKFIDKTNSVKIYKITLVGHNEAKRAELEQIFKTCDVSAECTNYMKRSSDMILTYTIQGSQEEHEKLTKLFYETSLVDAFEC
ncbi:MAG: MgtC/SapB family protein [Sphingobacteriaceae bacterium]|jgi:putative Mg2+ transporter-C (MgtC) family protein